MNVSWQNIIQERKKLDQKNSNHQSVIALVCTKKMARTLTKNSNCQEPNLIDWMNPEEKKELLKPQDDEKDFIDLKLPLKQFSRVVGIYFYDQKILNFFNQRNDNDDWVDWLEKCLTNPQEKIKIKLIILTKT